MVVLVGRILTQEQVLGLDVLVYYLVVMELAYGIGEVGYLSYAFRNFVVGKLGLDDSVEGAALDEFQLEIGVAARNASAKSLDHAFDVGGADEVVYADFILEGAQEHVQTVQAVLAGGRPVLADFHDDFFFVVAFVVTWVLYPKLCAVELVCPNERKWLDEFDAFRIAVVLEVRVVVKPPLVFCHGVVWAQRQIARYPVHCFC